MTTLLAILSRCSPMVGGVRNVHYDVVGHTYRLPKMQKEFFFTKDARLLKECRRTDKALMLFCENYGLTGERIQKNAK
ncbi:MAG: hypothetical protein IJR13_07310 [Bacteroidales bacterium]|nr:hypothetical protein [Bacteroidales bacterium]